MSELKEIHGVACRPGRLILFNTAAEVGAFARGVELGSLQGRTADCNELYPGDCIQVEWDEKSRTAMAWYAVGSPARKRDDDSRADAVICDECGEWIPDDEPDLVNRSHAESCSLHPGDGDPRLPSTPSEDR